MRKIFSMLLGFILLVGCKKNIQREYYENGQLKSEITMDRNGNRDGLTTVYYENGEVMKKAVYREGKPIDTIFKYDKGGRLEGGEFYSNDSIYNLSFSKIGQVIKKGGFSINNIKNGWVKEYDSLSGDIKSKSYLLDVYGKDYYVNNHIQLNEKGDTIYGNSFYTKVQIPDTMILEKPYIGKIVFNSNRSNDSLLVLIGKNIEADFRNINKVKIDSFYDKNQFVYIPEKLGFDTIRGVAIQKILITKESQTDSTMFDVVVKDRPMYFEKVAFVKK